jgi:hypothetical protein
MFKTDYTQNKQLVGEVAAAGIMAGASLLGTGAQATFTGKMNRKTRKWSEKEREINRQYALQDYATMNEYNSPRAQMARFKEAGLNPNLIYGQQNEGATVRSTEQAKWNPETPQFDIGSAVSGGIQTYNDLRMANANLDLIAKEGAVKTAEIAYKTAMTSQVAAQTAKTEFETKTAATLAQYSQQAAEANLRKTMTDTAYTVQQQAIALQRNEREALQSTSSLRLNVLQALKLKAENAKTEEERKSIIQARKNAEIDQKLKEADLRLKEKGVQPHDNIIFRTGIQWLDNIIGKNPGSTMKERVKAWGDSTYKENKRLDSIKREKKKQHWTN